VRKAIGAVVRGLQRGDAAQELLAFRLGRFVDTGYACMYHHAAGRGMGLNAKWEAGFPKWEASLPTKLVEQEPRIHNNKLEISYGTWRWHSPQHRGR
jgi:hypothetical protein